MGREVVVSVQDSGSGIEEADRERIFEPLYSTKGSDNNAGLGLSICKRIVDGCGGRIELQSEVGVGTTFRVFLPRSDDSIDFSKAPLVDSRSVETSPLRILVIDDEPSLLMLLKAYLQGHDVECADSGSAALRCIENDPERDLVLCDIMMPDLTGVEVHAQVQSAHPELAKRFVFITGGAFGEETQARMDGLPNQRVYKPFVLGDILRVVEEAGVWREQRDGAR